MFVMLSVRTTSVCERHNKVTTTTANNTTTTTTTSKATNTQNTQTTQSQLDSAVTSSLTTTFDNLLINKNSIEKIFTKSVSFDKNINQSNLSLAQPNNLKEPPAQQVIHFRLLLLFSSCDSSGLVSVRLFLPFVSLECAATCSRLFGTLGNRSFNCNLLHWLCFRSTIDNRKCFIDCQHPILHPIPCRCCYTYYFGRKWHPTQHGLYIICVRTWKWIEFTN